MTIVETMAKRYYAFSLDFPEENGRNVSYKEVLIKLGFSPVDIMFELLNTLADAAIYEKGDL